MLKIAICDDNQAFLDQIKEYVHQWNENAQITTFSDGDTLISQHNKSPFDLLLLDVVMPLINGIDIAKEIRQNDTGVHIVFLTSSAEYAVESYTVKADNYLLKPINKNSLFSCLDYIYQKRVSKQKFLLIKSASVTHRIFIDNIEYIEAQNKNTILHLTDGTTIKSTNQLYVFEEQLTPKDGFFKISRSYIINVCYVHSYSVKEVCMLSNITIPISRKLHQEFESIYFSTLFNKVGEL